MKSVRSVERSPRKRTFKMRRSRELRPRVHVRERERERGEGRERERAREREREGRGEGGGERGRERERERERDQRAVNARLTPTTVKVTNAWVRSSKPAENSIPRFHPLRLFPTIPVRRAARRCVRRVTVLRSIRCHFSAAKGGC